MASNMYQQRQYIMAKIFKPTLKSTDIQHDIDLLVYLLPEMSIHDVPTDIIHRVMIDLMEFRDLLKD